MADLKVAPHSGGPDEEERLLAGELTEMEEWIMNALAHGEMRQEICKELGISSSLYHYHLHALRRYFRVRTTMEAVVGYVSGKKPSPKSSQESNQESNQKSNQESKQKSKQKSNKKCDRVAGDKGP